MVTTGTTTAMAIVLVCVRDWFDDAAEMAADVADGLLIELEGPKITADELKNDTLGPVRLSCTVIKLGNGVEVVEAEAAIEVRSLVHPSLSKPEYLLTNRCNATREPDTTILIKDDLGGRG